MHPLLILALIVAAAGCRGEARVQPDPAPWSWDAIGRIDPASYAVASPCGDALALGADGTCGDPLTHFADGGRTFVVDQRDRRASDRGPGSAERPWRTISRAAEPGALRPGDAVVVREGVYREAVRPTRGGRPGALVTFAAWPGETVILSGADPAPDGWQRVGNAWRRPWTLEPMEAYNDDPVFRRELIVAGGRVLHQAPSAEALTPGTFWIEGPDTAPVAVWARFPGDATPEAARVEIASRDVLFGPIGADRYAACGSAGQPGYLRIVGLTLRHAANRAQTGALCAGSAGSRVEDVAVEWTNGTGVDASGRGHVFHRTRADHNGQLGWMGHGSGVTLEDGTALGNNWKGYDAFWEAGGGKWDQTTDLVIRRHYAAWNDGPGIWLDADNHHNTIEGALVEDNAMAGIMLELRTTHTLVQHNLVRRTRWLDWSASGLLSQAASRNVMVHNTVIDNHGIGMWLRLDPAGRAPDGWTTVAANWIVGNARSGEEAREIAVEAASPSLLESYRIDGNVYGTIGARDPTMRSAFFAHAPSVDGRSEVSTRTDGLREWRRATGFDRVSEQLSGDDIAPRAAPRVSRLPDAGAPRAPAIPGRAVGADWARVRGGGGGR